MAGLFGVRDLGLEVLAFFAVRHPSWLGFVCLFNVAHDVGDVMALDRPLVQCAGIDRTVVTGLVTAVSGIGTWTAARAMV